MYSSGPIDLTMQISHVKSLMEIVDTLDGEAKSAIYHTVIELSKDIDALLQLIDDLEDKTDMEIFQEAVHAMGLVLQEVGKDLLTIALKLKSEESH